MDLDRIPQDEWCVRRIASALTAAICALLCAGCASPGPPRPPSLRLPALVTDLSAERWGDHVRLKWTTPARTTDDLPVQGAMTAQICRETGIKSTAPATRMTTCAPVLRLAVVPGPSEVVDPLPRAMTSDPIALITYRIQILNTSEHSAGNSTAAAFAAAGKAPLPLDALRGSANEKGAVLEWNPARANLERSPDQLQIMLTRRDTSSASTETPKTKHSSSLLGSGRQQSGHKSSSPSNGQPPHEGTRLRTPETSGGGNTAGTIDASAKMGETYTYTAERVITVTLGPHTLEMYSEPSSPVTVEMRDTFPPAVPTGLATIPGVNPATSTAYIDLSWEPNGEPDLAGYLVYRQLASQNGDPQGPLARLTTSPVVAPAYRDVAVSAGQRYIYQVTAVDAAGNESAPSAKAQEGLDSSVPEPPEIGFPQQAHSYTLDNRTQTAIQRLHTFATIAEHRTREQSQCRHFSNS